MNGAEFLKAAMNLYFNPAFSIAISPRCAMPAIAY